MKISLALLFLVLITVTQFCASNVLSKRGVQKEDVLLSDENGIQNGSDVIMVKPGPLNVILAEGDKLIFEVCSMQCTTDFLVCYEADSAGQNVLEQCDSKCGFFVTTRGDKISIMTPISPDRQGDEKFDKCFQVEMENGETSVMNFGEEIEKPTTCSPKIENGIVKLTIVNASSECPVSIKNAIIKPDPTTAAPSTPGQYTGTSSGNSSKAATDESESFLDNYWWIFLILGILIVGAIIGIGIYFYIRRSRSKKAKKTVAPPRKIQHSKSPVVLQPSTEPAQNRSETTPASVFQQSSILSHKSLMWSKKENDGNKSAEETDLTSMKPTA